MVMEKICKFKQKIARICLIFQKEKTMSFKFNEAKISDLDSVLKPFSSIGKEWMLVSSGISEKYPLYNTMTASWGGFGYLWEKPVAHIYIRPQRHTFKFSEENEFMSLSFFGGGQKKALGYCGKISGKDEDKAKNIGLNAVLLEPNLIGFEEANLILKCKKLYTSYLEEKNFLSDEIPNFWYQNKDFHRVYICEIMGFYTKE